MSLKQPYNAEKFNFTKVPAKEVRLFARLIELIIYCSNCNLI